MVLDNRGAGLTFIMFLLLKWIFFLKIEFSYWCSSSNPPCNAFTSNTPHKEMLNFKWNLVEANLTPLICQGHKKTHEIRSPGELFHLNFTTTLTDSYRVKRLIGCSLGVLQIMAFDQTTLICSWTSYQNICHFWDDEMKEIKSQKNKLDYSQD